MCIPAAIGIPSVLGGLQAAQTGLGYVAASQDASAEQKFLNTRYSQTAKAATENYLRSVDQDNLRLEQDTAASSEAAIQNQVAGQSAKGAVVAQTSSAGVEGNSVAELLNNFGQIESRNNANLYTNLQWEQQQMQQSELASRAQAQSQINSAVPSPQHQPSLLGAALQIGTIGLESYDTQNYRMQRGPYDPTKPNPTFIPGSLH